MFYENRNNKKSRYIFVAIFVVVAFLAFTKSTFAATISITPAQQQVMVDNVVKVRVGVNTQSLYINNAEGVISFPKDVVDVISIDTSNSIFGLWVEQPSFSNIAGTITFNGGIANPGYTGTNGEVFSIVVRAKKVGTASLLFASASVRANDGLGTDVLSVKNSAAIAIVAATSVQEESVKITPTTQTTIEKINQAITGPVFASLTHPDQTHWYPFKDGTITWDIPVTSKGTQMLFDGLPNTIPRGSVSNITRREFKNIKDGISYFHARYITTEGWSSVGTFVFHIDSIPPEDTNTIITKKEDGRPVITLEGDDSISGIDYFTVTIEGKESEKIPANNNNATYIVSSLPYLGSYDVRITAFDKAGNKKESKTKIIIDTLVAPIIKAIPSPIKINKPITIIGTTAFTGEDVYVFIKSPEKKVEMFLVDADILGAFSFETYRVTQEGTYEVWAQIINDHGEKSIESKHQRVVVASTLLQKSIAYGIRYGYIVLLLALIVMSIIAFDLHHKLLNDETSLSKLVLGVHRRLFKKNKGVADEQVRSIVKIPRKKKRISKKKDDAPTE